MNRIDSYEDLADKIVRWLNDYYWEHNTTPYDICKRGRCDRGIDEYKDCIDVKTEYINKLEDLELL